MKMKLASRGFLRAAVATVSVVGIVFAGLYATPAQADSPTEEPCQADSLETYTITDGVVSAGADCLGAVVIADGVEEIGNSAFEEGLLQSISIPNSVTSIGSNAFDMSSLRSISFGAGSALETIGTSAFYQTDLQSINLSNCTSLDSIGAGAFQQVTTLESVILPNSVTSIGQNAFAGSSTLTSVSLPTNPGFTLIREGTFGGTDLVSISIPGSVTTIEMSAFSNTTALDSITIPNSVTSIGEAAFYESSLENITFQDRLSDSALSIGVNAFSASDLTSISIPNGVTEIEEGTFASTLDLESVTLPNSLTSIGDFAFAGSGITSINIPNNLESIGDEAFAASHLESITFQGLMGPNLDIGHGAFALSDLRSISLPIRVNEIAPDTFSGARDLAFVTIPNTVTSLGEYAFFNADSLKSITIPANVSSIGSHAFESSTALSSVYFLGLAPPVLDGSDHFSGVPALAKAFIQPSATGFGEPGSPWQGLTVSELTPSSSLYRTWQVPLPQKTTGPVAGDTVYASAFERALPRTLFKSNGLGGPQYFSDVATYPTPEEYVYRITRTANDESTSVDLQSSDGYEDLDAGQQQDWYDEISPINEYQFSWRAFLCVGVEDLTTPTELSLSYATREDAISSGSGFDSAHNYMFQDAANDWSAYNTPSTRTLVGTKMGDGVYADAFLGDSDNDGLHSKVYGIMDVSSSCGVGKTLEALTILDSNDEAITTKSFVIPSQLRLDFQGENVSIDPVGITIGVTGRIAAPEFHAALWGLTTIADPNAPPPTPPTQPTQPTQPPTIPTTSTQPAASASSAVGSSPLATTGSNAAVVGLVFGFALGLGTLGAWLIWIRRKPNTWLLQV